MKMQVGDYLCGAGTYLGGKEIRREVSKIVWVSPRMGVVRHKIRRQVQDCEDVERNPKEDLIG